MTRKAIVRRFSLLGGAAVLFVGCDSLVGITNTKLSDSGALDASAGAGGSSADASTETGGSSADVSTETGGSSADASTDAHAEDRVSPVDAKVDGCKIANGGVETCDGRDDDCDGIVDDVKNKPSCPGPGAGGLGCDATGTPLTSAPENCVNAKWVCPLTKPLYWYLDADNDGYPEPLPGMSGVLGPIPYTYNYGPTCSKTPPSASPPPPAGANWISSTYDWANAVDRAADPLRVTLHLSTINEGFDCCDVEADANPGQSNFFQAPSHGPLPAACTGAGVKAWDFNCDGVLQRRAPDGSNTPWTQCAVCVGSVPGWNTLGFSCPKDCGDASGEWISYWGSGVCVAGQTLKESPLCH